MSLEVNSGISSIGRLLGSETLMNYMINRSSAWFCTKSYDPLEGRIYRFAGGIYPLSSILSSLPASVAINIHKYIDKL